MHNRAAACGSCSVHLLQLWLLHRAERIGDEPPFTFFRTGDVSNVEAPASHTHPTGTAMRMVPAKENVYNPAHEVERRPLRLTRGGFFEANYSVGTFTATPHIHSTHTHTHTQAHGRGRSTESRTHSCKHSRWINSLQQRRRVRRGLAATRRRWITKTERHRVKGSSARFARTCGRRHARSIDRRERPLPVADAPQLSRKTPLQQEQEQTTMTWAAHR